MRGEERDIRPDVLLGDVQEPVVADQPHPERIVPHQMGVQVLRPQPRIALQEPDDVISGFLDQPGIQDLPIDRIAVTRKTVASERSWSWPFPYAWNCVSTLYRSRHHVHQRLTSGSRMYRLRLVRNRSWTLRM